jgi:tetratricopeptide (TPR) repeat protein
MGGGAGNESGGTGTKELALLGHAGHGSSPCGRLPGRGGRLFEKSSELAGDGNSNGKAQAINDLAWLFATCSEAKFRDAARAVTLGKKAVELRPNAGMLWNRLGPAHYRAGDWKAAVTALEKAMSMRGGGDAFDWFFLAMAHWQQGNEEQARSWYGKAVAWMDENRSEDEELIRFRAEAAELLGVKDPLPGKKIILPE